MPSADHERRDALPVGTVLRGFTIQALIAHGGFGIGNQAGHNLLGLLVAIGEYLNLGIRGNHSTAIYNFKVASREGGIDMDQHRLVWDGNHTLSLWKTSIAAHKSLLESARLLAGRGKAVQPEGWPSLDSTTATAEQITNRLTTSLTDC